jgi:hypothetical protein
MFVAMEAFDDCEGLIVAILLEQPAGRIWQPENTHEDDQGRKTF